MTLEIALTHRFSGFALDVDVNAGGGVTVFFGRSGAGKTSLINAVAGLLTPDKGRITLEGETLLDTANGINLAPHKRRMGYVFQDARLFPHLSVEQNLMFGARYATGRAKITLAQITKLLGLEALLTRAPTTLSGGERQRVALGRALLCQPRLLLMDEPLAALDGPRKQEILPYLERLRDGPLGLPILYVSHAVDEVARLADTLVLLENGKVRTAGPLFEVMADPAAIPLLGVREAGAVIEADVMLHGEDGLSVLETSAGALELPGVQAPIGARVRLRVLAQDVILSRTRPKGLSSVNILPVTVTGVQRGDGPGAAISLQAGRDQLLARVTSRAVSELELAKGVACYAVIKATTVAPSSIGR